MKSNIEKVYSKLPKTELAKVELGYLQSVSSDAEKAVKKYDNTKDIVKAWQNVKQTLNSIKKDVVLVKRSRKANIMGIEGVLQDINGEIKTIDARFKELGIDGKNSKELTTAKRSAYVLGNFLKDLNNIDSLEDVNI
ncbi:MAG: hypothetical protein H8E16_19495 [Flavobacteriales bacterium]|nr:hypothetical protein [Flavobacteriales bacterium]